MSHEPWAMLRVITGLAKGRRLECPPGNLTRPPTDMLKGAVFNILAGRVEGSRVLDLYCGCGAFGIEALSRGATSCVFVDRSADAIGALRGNLERTGLERFAEVRRAAVAAAVRSLASAAQRFSLAFVDPPFAASRTRAGAGEVRGILEAARRLLAPDGLLLLRLPVRGGEGGGADPFPAPDDARRYGDSEVFFYGRE